MSDPADVNTDGTVNADDLEQQVLEDAINGVQSFSDGTHTVGMMDLEKRLAIADRLRRDETASGNAWFGLRTTLLRSPGGWE